MSIQKQGFNISFGQGLDTKTDPNQVAAGKMLNLTNVVFQKGGRLDKRNGFKTLATLPSNANATSATTLNGSLLTVGSSLFAYSPDTNQLVNQGSVQPAKLSAQSMVRTSYSETVCDAVVADTDLVCVVSQDSAGVYYQVSEASSGQSIVPRKIITTTGALPRVFVVGNNFVITWLDHVSTPFTINFIGVSTGDPTIVSSPTQVSSLVSSLSAGYDGAVANNQLYLAWNSSVANTVDLASVNSALVVSFTQSFATTGGADLISVATDLTTSTPNVYVTYWSNSTSTIKTTMYSFNLLPMLSPTTVVTSVTISKLTSITTHNLANIYYEVINDYPSTSIRSDFLRYAACSSTGSVTPPVTVLRGLGLGAKPFIDNNTIYLVTVYGQSFQPTYFIVNTATSKVVAKLAYGNAFGYLPTQVLPNISTIGSLHYFSYLFKSTLVPVNKSQGVASVAGVYAQTGVNLATVTLDNVYQANAEIARDLHLTGGFLWMYDASIPVEHGFHVWPEDVQSSTTTGSGGLTAQQYFYQFTYEWTDGQGNLHRSAPSVPLAQTTTTSSSTNTLVVPTLRITNKPKVRIVGYRWSTAQQVFYQFTSITSPVINDPTVDTVTIVDANADSAILGNTILYTTGGVVEDIAAPACSTMTLFGSRLFVNDSEDPNLIWYSKQVIENTPVEMSDLFTIFVAPTAGVQNSAGPITALSAMDDKLVIFKQNVIYYITGRGPDNTGSNNDFSDPVFITSTVGCSNPQSVVFTPQGIMFQSNKGIWRLGRDLNTTYIGAPVEQFNDVNVISAVLVPGTNQVRFNLADGSLLMYDYYYDQWGTFSNSSAVSSTIFQGLHTYVDSFGRVKQETPGAYLDDATPVTISFTTSWWKVTNLQGFQRAYFMYLMGNYESPHTLDVTLSYDYDLSKQQQSQVRPVNSTSIWGSDALWGGSTPWGGGSNVEQMRVFFKQQKCQSIQITVQENYDPAQGIPAGAGLTLSGINLVVGGKLVHPKLPANQSVG